MSQQPSHGQQAAPRKKRHGCLYSILGVLGLIVLIIIIVSVSSSGGGGGSVSNGGPGTSGPPRPGAAHPRAQLLWDYIGSSSQGPQATYVARVTNPGSEPVSTALDAKALDASGAIVGNDQPGSGPQSLPVIPAHSHVDYVGMIGGSAGTLTSPAGPFAELKAKPAKITVSQANPDMGNTGALLKASDVHLSHGNASVTTNGAPLAYNLSARVTNTTGRTVAGGMNSVTAEAILYDAAGHIVGGANSGPNDMPSHVAAGASYRADWTAIPAAHPAVRAVYMVWTAA